MEEAASHWSRVQERGSALGLRFTAACYQYLGRWLTLPLIYAVVWYFFLTDPSSRAASRAFLERVHARQSETGTPDWQPSFWQSFLQFRAFANSITDRIALWSGQHERFDFTFHGREHFDRLAADRRGAILFGAHLGSFDVLRVLSIEDNVPVNVLMYTRHAPKINRVLRAISRDADLRVISPAPDSAATALEIKACIGRGEHVAILADRTEPSERHRVHSAEFLGAKAQFPEAPFMLPVILGCPAIMMVALRSGTRRYDIFAEVLSESRESRESQGGAARQERPARAQQLLERYVERLEHYCVRAPRQWFNFYDFWSGKG